MTFDDFDKFMDLMYADCKAVRNDKGREYAHSADRFANFKRVADHLHRSPLEVGFTYMYKHLDSIASYVGNGGEVYSGESIRSRFIDLITYAFLMAGMAEEQELAGMERARNDDGRVLRQGA